MFKAIDLEFANATEKALNERITDAIIALQEIVTKGQLHEDVAPHQKNADYTDDGRFAIKVDTIDEAIEIIEGLEKTFDTMRQIVVADDLKINKVNSKEDQFVLYRAMSKRVGNMLLYIRPEGAYGYDRQVEYGNSKGVEASISFIVDPFNPHKLMLPKDSNGVSIRFDREGRLVDEDPATDMRDPTRQEGLISVDVSSVMGPPDSIPVKIGRFIAAGNRIRARRQGTDDSLHHNTNYFDQEKYGDADGFGDLARNVAHQIELMKQTLRAKQIGKSASSKIRSAAQEQVDLPEAA
ncbi:hypothetical protein EOL96_04980 [Candidatus Saccharibacteria bacterium]|nr:hypothetical protein [Candidatus Saccharibacteria bacterium]